MAKDKAKDKKPAKANEPTPEKIVCRNRRATHDFDIIETIEAGLVLTGTEVKSLRSGSSSLEEAYARMEGNELWLLKSDIPEYAMGNRMNHDPKRKRKMLLHRRELNKFAKGAEEQGYTLIPLRVYFLRGLVKVELAMAKGKKLHDKRAALKTKEARREIDRALRSRRPNRD